jgi:general secretion pathway protein L
MSMTLDSTLRGGARAALRWWVGELAALLPAGLRARLSASSRILILAFDGETLTAKLPAAGRRGEIRALRIGDGGVPASLAQAVRRARAGGRRVVIHLAQPCSLRSRMRLPLAAEENLREVIGFELDRQTPFTPAEVYFTYRVAARDEAAGRLWVELIVVPRPIVDAALAAAARVGLRPDAVEVAEPDGTANDNLLPPGQQASRWRLSRLWPYALGGVVVLLTIGLLLTRLDAAHDSRRVLAQELAAARKEADAGARLRDEIARTAEEGRFLVTRKRAQPPVSVVLYELTRLLPDDAWLSDLQIAGGDVQAIGSAASATAVIERLNRSPLFADAGFRSPVMRDPSSNRESFDIAMHIVREPAR